MKLYVGLDVSMKETSICVVDKVGKVFREVKVATEPTAILAVLMDETLAIERIGLEGRRIFAMAVWRVATIQTRNCAGSGDCGRSSLECLASWVGHGPLRRYASTARGRVGQM